MGGARNLQQKLGRRVRARREELQLTQVEVAESIGLDGSTIRAIESGRRGCSLEVLVDLADRLNVAPGTLLGEEPAHGSTAASEAAVIVHGMDRDWQKTSLDVLRALQRQSSRRSKSSP